MRHFVETQLSLHAVLQITVKKQIPKLDLVNIDIKQEMQYDCGKNTLDLF
jgi:hypothetical protein